jgi:glycosyltransferase involved in cell wall biosynthesis
MRFCFVTTFFPPQHFGGDAVMVASLANLLASAGHSVEVVHNVDAFELLRGNVPASPFVLHPGVLVHPLRSPWGAAAPLATHATGRPMLVSPTLRRLLARDFDVLHWHNLSLMGGAGAVGIPRTVQLCTLHDYWWICPTSILFKYNREACQERACIRCTLRHGRPPQLWRWGGLLAKARDRIHRFLAPSEFVRDRYAKSHLGINACVLAGFVPPAPEIESRDEGYYLFVGRLEVAKGLQTVIPVFARSGRRLRIAGSGNYEPELRRMAQGHSNIEFLGRVDHADLPPLYAGARATILPSICYETFGLTLLESLQQRRPVVVSDFGAPKEIVQRTGGGVVYSNLKEFEAILDRLDRDPTHATELGATGHSRLAEFSPERHLTGYLQIVEEEKGRWGARRASA